MARTLSIRLNSSCACRTLIHFPYRQADERIFPVDITVNGGLNGCLADDNAQLFGFQAEINPIDKPRFRNMKELLKLTFLNWPQT